MEDILLFWKDIMMQIGYYMLIDQSHKRVLLYTCWSCCRTELHRTDLFSRSTMKTEFIVLDLTEKQAAGSESACRYSSVEQASSCDTYSV